MKSIAKISLFVVIDGLPTFIRAYPVDTGKNQRIG